MTTEDPHDTDDLDGYETSMSRFSSRIRGWLAVLVAATLVIPLGGWLIDELAFRRSASEVGDAVDQAVVDAVMLVRAIGCDGRVSSGSAFVVASDGGPVVVTNRHVVRGARTVSLRALEGGPSTTAAGVALSRRADVALLEPADPEALPAPLTFGPSVEAGDEVRLVGFPAALPFTTSGTVAERSPARVLLDLEVDPGASGSPVVDQEERVVAQVFARTPDGLGVATPVELLVAAIGDVEPAPAC